MARAQATDFYHAFKFHVVIGTPGITGASDILSGFTAVTMPEQTLENVEYKEGVFLYRRKFPGDVTFSDITLSRGVAKKGTAFWDWINAVTLGEQYRVDLNILHFHRDDIQGLTDFTKATPKRIIRCFDCFPIRVKPGADFDAQASDISIEEMDLAIERFELSDTN